MKQKAYFHFKGRLKKLIPSTPGGTVNYSFNGNPAIKDPIEALGIPHTEVDLILVGQSSVDFGYQLQDGDRVDVYPWGKRPQLESLQHLSSTPNDPPRFILDVHLGKLARRLRMLGFDCLYRNDYSDPQIIRLALDEQRIILTRDRGILKQSCVRFGYLVGSGQVQEQTEEVLERFDLYRQIKALRRCPQCNGLLARVAKEQILDRLLPKTACYYEDFQQCNDCKKLYWQGSHYGKINAWIEGLQ